MIDVSLHQDLHLAKRYYDKAAGTMAGAWIPVKLALWVLAAHSTWLAVVPALPDSLAWLGNHVFVLPIPSPGATPSAFEH